ncbi:unnamed protein product [Mytilus coruscus]|uniref:Uncharacterized protein n=1 Tax=Mytilus coruscus TaxID=42192 RepID=A0A6J8ANH8_MYTCO|nr:unnamed protein product [Mytilus coruscus]
MEIWKTRTENFSMLFKTIETTTKITITSSIAVMRARTMLEIQLEALEDVLSKQAQYIANYKEDKLVMEAIENESPENRKISKYRRTVPETKAKGTFRESLNCPNCRKTCHKKCLVPLSKLAWTCEAMTDGKCTVCDRKCDAKDHVLSRKKYRVVYVTKFYSGEDVAARHEKREGTFSLLQNTIHLIEKCIIDINSTALTKDALSSTKYIQNLTNKEMRKKGEGYEMRIQILRNILKHLEQNSISNLSMDYLMKS